MGFDIYGNRPKSKQGEYLRTGYIWWAPIVDKVEEVNQKFELGLETEYWKYNDYDGIPDEETCLKLATCLKLYYGDNVINNTPVMKEFVEFLETCGGFEIW